MTDKRLKELVPDIEYGAAIYHDDCWTTDIDPELFIKQIENLRKAVKVMTDTIEFQKRIGYTEDQVKDICGDFIECVEQITGIPYSELGE